MNINIFNSQYKNISGILSEINEKKKRYEELVRLNRSKEERNSAYFKNIYSKISDTELEIKTLVDDRFFTYSEHKELVSEDEVYSAEGFLFVNNLGCITKSIEGTRNSYKPYNTVIDNSGKNIVANYSDQLHVNEINFSFHSAGGEPVFPSEIFITYSGTREKLYEPNFRFFNRNSKDNKNMYLFTPKKITKVEYYFEKPVNRNNFEATLISNQYSSSDEDYAVFQFSNPKLLKKMNLSKTSDESIIPLEFKYSKDGLEYIDISFNEYNEAVLDTEGTDDIKVKVSSIYSGKNINEELVSTTASYKSLETAINDFTYSTTKNSKIINYSVNFSYSTYRQLVEKFSEFNIEIQDFIEESGDVYALKEEFLNIVDSDSEVNKNISLFDDVSILMKDRKYFNFFLSKGSGHLYCPPFLYGLPFVVNITIEEPKEQIDSIFYTPILFDLSIKG